MRVGFTGTRSGMTAQQQEKLGEILRSLGVTQFNHGDCVGADDEAATLVKAWLPQVRIVCHPPEDNSHRAHNKNYDEIRPPLRHLARNRAIVQETQVLAATPWESQWQPRGGTWYTIDYARKQGRAVYIIFADGRIEFTEGRT